MSGFSDVGIARLARPLPSTIVILSKMATDWFRNTEWNDDIASAFEAKLKRARDKHQYLRIQAIHIQPFSAQIALQLLDRFFALEVSRPQMSQAWLQRAQCFAQLGQIQWAIDAALESIEWERKFPNSKTEVTLWFPLLIAETGRADLFDLALELLSSRQNMFPNQSFHHFAAISLIQQQLGDHEAATRTAQRALEASDRKHSGFSRHPKVGLVGEREQPLVDKIRDIASLPS